jgi:endonuclease YncB( thermonuclease family)
MPQCADYRHRRRHGALRPYPHRLDDFDAPELHHARCPREWNVALAAKLELERLVPTLRLREVPCATRNYGRLCAHADGLASHMIGAHLMLAAGRARNGLIHG